MKKKLSCFVLLVFLSVALYAQKLSTMNQGDIGQSSYFKKIPYRKVAGKLIIDVSINGKTYHFMLDTGAPLAISSQICRELNLSTIEEATFTDQSRAEGKTGIIILPQLDIGDLRFTNTPGAVLPEVSAQVFKCVGIDGIIGSNMLRNSIVQFDEKNSQVLITDDPKNLELKKKPYQQMVLSETQSDPSIKVMLKKGKKAFTDQLLFDSGDEDFYSMATGAYEYFRGRAEVIDKIAEGKGSSSWGLGGIAEDQQQFALNIPEFIINEVTFKNVFAVTTHHPSSRIGAALLDYGKVTLDYRNKRFYFEPYEKSPLEKVSRRDWGFLMTFRDDKLVVGIIWDKALESEINAGDEVLRFDGLDYSGMTFCDLMLSEGSSSENEKEAIAELKDVKTGQIKRVTVRRL